jgi:hypothetical protein
MVKGLLFFWAISAFCGISRAEESKPNALPLSFTPAVMPKSETISAAAATTATSGVSPASPTFEKNNPVEDFCVVSIVSLPFTALWSILGAGIVASISQQKFPPELSNDTLFSTGAIALGASVGIGLVSVSWGRGKANSAPAAIRPNDFTHP